MHFSCSFLIRGKYESLKTRILAYWHSSWSKSKLRQVEYHYVTIKAVTVQKLLGGAWVQKVFPYLYLLIMFTIFNTTLWKSKKHRDKQSLTQCLFYFIFKRCNYYLAIYLQIRNCTKIKFSVKDFFSKCDQIHNFLRIWSYLLKKSLMENFIFCAVRIALTFYIFLFFSSGLSCIALNMDPIHSRLSKYTPWYFLVGRLC